MAETISASLKRFQCSQCPKSFTRKHNLKGHLLSHSGEKPFRCPKCDSRFRRRNDLRIHDSEQHSSHQLICNEIQDNISSAQCGRTFPNKRALVRHKKSHQSALVSNHNVLPLDERIEPSSHNPKNNHDTASEFVSDSVTLAESYTMVPAYPNPVLSYGQPILVGSEANPPTLASRQEPNNPWAASLNVGSVEFPDDTATQLLHSPDNPETVPIAEVKNLLKYMFPLHQAIDLRVPEATFRLLLDYVENINQEKMTEGRAIHVACRSRVDVLYLTHLLRRGADIHGLMLSGRSAIHEASRNGNVDCVKLLIDYGADIESQDRWKKTPLYAACENGQVNSVRALIRKGANLKHKARDEFTPLHAACYGSGSGDDHVDCIRLLIDYGADIESQDDFGQTPLYEACRNGQVNCAKVLIQEGANLKHKALDKSTPLHAACYGSGSGDDYVDCIRLLIDNGADIESQNKWGCTPLHAAFVIGDVGIVKLLIDNGADLETRDHDGKTPLLSLFWNNNGLEVVKLLLNTLIESGANTSATDFKGNNILHHALMEYSYRYEAYSGRFLEDKSCRYASVIEKLVQLDVDIDQRNNHNLTPLQVYQKKIARLAERLEEQAPRDYGLLIDCAAHLRDMTDLLIGLTYKEKGLLKSNT